MRAAIIGRIMWNTREDPAIKGRWPQAVARAVAWEIHKYTSGKPREIPVWNGKKMRGYPGDHAANELIYFDGYPDYHEMRFVEHYLRLGDNFLDVGANEGMYTVLAASVIGNEGHIDSFEPIPRNLERLRENVSLNGFTNVEVHPAAVGAESTTVRFAVEGPRSHMSTTGDAGATEIEVPLVRLRDELGPLRYAMGKMDIEGAEPLALQGAEPLLAAGNPPVWLLEVYGHMHRYGFTEKQFEQWLKDRGYDFAQYDSDARQLKFLNVNWDDLNEASRASNILAIHRASKEEVLERIRTSARSK